MTDAAVGAAPTNARLDMCFQSMAEDVQQELKHAAKSDINKPSKAMENGF